MEFKEFVAEAIGRDAALVPALAERFEVAQSTVGKWAFGTAVPNPRLQQKIREFIWSWESTR